MRACSEYFEEAIFDGDRFRVAQWLQSVQHAPSDDEIVAVCDAVCSAAIDEVFTARQDVRPFLARADAIRSTLRALLAEHRAVDVAVAAADPLTVEFVDALVGVVRLSDPALAEHLNATAALTRRIGLELGLEADVVARAEITARVHDLGHVSYAHEPFAMSLDDVRHRQIRLHIVAAESVLAASTRLAPFAPLVRAHHERYDGSGGPDGLVADEIPIEARIVAVADAFHTLTTIQPAHDSMMVHDALARIAAERGSIFDPLVVDATLSVCRFDRRRARATA